MSYQVLARTWRPQKFEDVVGQDHVTQTLKNAITDSRVAHAYCFSGARGVGKTTTARILAKALNCREGPTPTPCDSCENCKEIRAGTSPDVVEIDGATYRRIENVRELQEKLQYIPAKSPCKVYSIDEDHMFTKEAFNALLKTLEEQPSHVHIVFATTDCEVWGEGTISSRGRMWGGLNGCTTSSLVLSVMPAFCCDAGIPEVLVQSSASGGATLSTSAHNCVLKASFSGPLSWTMVQPATASATDDVSLTSAASFRKPGGRYVGRTVATYDSRSGRTSMMVS